MTVEQADRLDSDPLRIALLVDSSVLDQYQREIIAQIQDSSFACIEAVILAQPVAGNEEHGGVLFEWYQRFDVRRRKGGQRDPVARVDCGDLLAGLPSVALGDAVDAVDASEIDALSGRAFDVVVNFGSADSNPTLALSTEYGVWSIVPGELGAGRRIPRYFWEAYYGTDVSAFTIVVDTPAGQFALSTGYYATQSTSLAWNRRQPHWASVVVLLQRLQVLNERGWAAASIKSTPLTAFAARVPREHPSNFQMVVWISKIAARKVTKRFRRRRVNHWRIATRVGSPLQLVEGQEPDLRGFQFHESPRGHYHADPFLWMRDGKHWLFFEDYSYATRRGTLGCAEVLGDGTLGPVQSVLERPYHLSYPCLFQDGDELYMIPETAANGTIELYRCAEFPGRWEFERTLFDFGGIDTTIVEAEGRYWLMTSVPEPHSLARQLCLYSASQLVGDWVPHPANPISTDIRANRSAGAFVKDGERLLYLSQDSSRSYGYSFTFHEITTLTTDEYAARRLLTVEPNWAEALTGTHTYARCGDVEAIDGVVQRLRSEAIIR